MKKIKEFFAHKWVHKTFKVFKWTFFILFVSLFVLVIIRMFHFVKLDKTNVQVEKIHAMKINMNDVLGENLPPDPGDNADDTIEGIDSNYNGIRDDVELAIFEKYPDSAKTRAALLQYALTQQMMLTQPFVNEIIATEIIRERSRANSCLSVFLLEEEKYKNNFGLFLDDSWEMEDFIEEIQFNTKQRKETKDIVIKNVRSFSGLEKEECDIDYLKLEN